MKTRLFIFGGSLGGLLSLTLLVQAESALDSPFVAQTSKSAVSPISNRQGVTLTERVEKADDPQGRTSSTATIRSSELLVRQIVENVKSPIGDRIRAAHALGNNLSSEEITLLFAFLQSLPGAENNLPGLRVLKNDVLNALRHQVTPPTGLTKTLAGIYANQAQDSVMRDYAIQHLTAWYEQGALDAPSAKETIRVVLQQAGQENDAIAGTALLGLHRLSTTPMGGTGRWPVPSGDPPLGTEGRQQPSVMVEKRKHLPVPSGQWPDGTGGSPVLPSPILEFGFDAQKISDRALSLARSAETPTATRITALQVCAERTIKEALPVAQSLAQNADSIPLQLSAIAALSRLGGPEQAVFLQQLESLPNEPLRRAIRAALQRLQQPKPPLL